MWRFWPILIGRARPDDTVEARLEKWNTYIIPALHKLIKIDLAVGHAGAFTCQKTGEAHSLGVWSLHATLLPDVEYLALAKPAAPDSDETPEVTAIGKARDLRALLGDAVQSQHIWGHLAYLYVWPVQADLDAFIRKLTTVDTFRERFGLTDTHLAGVVGPSATEKPS